MSTNSSNHENVLTAVAESIGSTLGALAARARDAKKAVTAEKSTGRRAARRTKTATRPAQKQVAKAGKTALEASGHPAAKLQKTLRKT